VWLDPNECSIQNNFKREWRRGFNQRLLRPGFGKINFSNKLSLESILAKSTGPGFEPTSQSCESFLLTTKVRKCISPLYFFHLFSFEGKSLETCWNNFFCFFAFSYLDVLRQLSVCLLKQNWWSNFYCKPT